MIDRHRRQHASLRPTGIAGLVLLGSLGGWVSGCADGAPGIAASGPDGARAAAPAELPPGAIQVGRDLYRVPIGADADGCRMYRLYSPTLLVTPAISYRSRAGGFTIDKRAAVCGPAPAAGSPPGPAAGERELGQRPHGAAARRRSPRERSAGQVGSPPVPQTLRGKPRCQPDRPASDHRDRRIFCLAAASADPGG